jgi:N-acetylglucosaminyldiphosphoundecaprenol N-acetyl-beta-D-mannosaminyltransferase
LSLVVDRRVNVLGVGVSAIDLPMALNVIGRWISAADQQYVCVTGVHGVMESQRDAELRRIHNEAGLVTPDGMPLVWISRLKGFKGVSRVYGPDLLLACCERFLSQQCRHFFYGAAEGVAELLGTRLASRFPGLVVAGSFSPPFGALSPQEDREIVTMINAAEPDIVWVGLSTPKQERWMKEHVGRVNAPVLIGVGAAFDFHAGLKPQAPRWMQRTGLEWFFRMITEPRRLGRRYMVNNPLFVINLFLQWTGVRRYELDPKR